MGCGCFVWPAGAGVRSALAQTGTTRRVRIGHSHLNRPCGWALQQNPLLAAVRQQHGTAAAGIVIAQTYPFNPSYFALVMVQTPALPKPGSTRSSTSITCACRSGSARAGKAPPGGGAVGPVARRLGHRNAGGDRRHRYRPCVPDGRLPTSSSRCSTRPFASTMHGRADPPPRRGRKVAGQGRDPGPG